GCGWHRSRTRGTRSRKYPNYPPPWPGAGPYREILDFLTLGFVDTVNPQKIPDIAHLGTFPLVGLESPDFAPPPVEHVADMVGGVAALNAQLKQLPGKTTLRYGGAVGIVAHAGSPP